MIIKSSKFNAKKIISLKHFVTNGYPFYEMAETALKKAVFTISNKEKRILEDENRYQYLKIRTNPKGDTTYWVCCQKKAEKCTASAMTITKNEVDYLRI